MALPVLLANEETFRPLFCDDNGRPNKPVAETCDEENEIEVVTHVSVEGAHESDQHATIPVLDDLESKGCKPETLLADTGYGRGQNIVDAADRGVDLVSPSCGPKPKAEEGDFTLDDFMFSADGQRIDHCPMDRAPAEQGVSGRNRRYARMDAKQCERCQRIHGPEPQAVDDVRAKNAQSGRIGTVRPRFSRPHGRFAVSHSPQVARSSPNRTGAPPQAPNSLATNPHTSPRTGVRTEESRIFR